jgi:hypothetical protein
MVATAVNVVERDVPRNYVPNGIGRHMYGEMSRRAVSICVASCARAGSSSVSFDKMGRTRESPALCICTSGCLPFRTATWWPSCDSD